MAEYKVDPKRVRDEVGETGVVVRATLEGVWGAHDIALLDGPSLFAWLRSRGGRNPYAENVVGHLLGHGRLTEET